MRESEKSGGALSASSNAREGTTGATVHNVNPSQGLGYTLPINRKSGGVVGCRLSGKSGSNYPDVRPCTSTLVPPHCTSSVTVTSRVAGGLDRRDGVRMRCKLPRKAQARSNENSLSVLVESQTKHEPMPAVNRAKGTPASNVQLKKEIVPTGNSFRARGGGNRGAKPCLPSKAREFSPP